MTLLEVVAGLGLLAALLTAVLLAKARYARQAAAADRRLQAVAAADALLSRRHESPRTLPLDGSGPVPGDGQLGWRTRPVPNADVEALGGRVVRLEILDDRFADRPVLVGVEFVVTGQLKRQTTPPAQHRPPAFAGDPVSP